MVHWGIIILMSGIFAYALFSDEIEYEEPPKPTTKKVKYVKVKRNGQWVDEEEIR